MSRRTVAPSRVHLPDTWDVDAAQGSACGARYGQPQTWPDGFAHEVVIDREEIADVTCPACRDSLRSRRERLAISLTALSCMRRSGETPAHLAQRDADLERLSAEITEIDSVLR